MHMLGTLALLGIVSPGLYVLGCLRVPLGPPDVLSMSRAALPLFGMTHGLVHNYTSLAGQPRCCWLWEEIVPSRLPDASWEMGTLV